MLELEPSSRRVRAALDFAREHLQERLTVPQLAEAACISERQFRRLFLKETGETPARAGERLRAEVARPRVEEGDEALDLIAKTSGFVDVAMMRRSVVRIFGQSPQVMRGEARARPIS